MFLNWIWRKLRGKKWSPWSAAVAALTGASLAGTGKRIANVVSGKPYANGPAIPEPANNGKPVTIVLGPAFMGSDNDSTYRTSLDNMIGKDKYILGRAMDADFIGDSIIAKYPKGQEFILGGHRLGGGQAMKLGDRLRQAGYAVKDVAVEPVAPFLPDVPSKDTTVYLSNHNKPEYQQFDNNPWPLTAGGFMPRYKKVM